MLLSPLILILIAATASLLPTCGRASRASVLCLGLYAPSPRGPGSLQKSRRVCRAGSPAQVRPSQWLLRNHWSAAWSWPPWLGHEEGAGESVGVDGGPWRHRGGGAKGQMPRAGWGRGPGPQDQLRNGPALNTQQVPVARLAGRMQGRAMPPPAAARPCLGRMALWLAHSLWAPRLVGGRGCSTS